MIPLSSLTLSPKPSQNPYPKPIVDKPSSHKPPKATFPTPTTDSGLKFHQKLTYLETLNINPTKVLSKNPTFRSTPLTCLKSVETCLSCMGIGRSALGRIYEMYPQLLTSNPYTDLYPVFDFLLNQVHIPYPDIQKSIIRCPRILICSVEIQLKPTLYFLRNLGFVGSNAINCQTALLLVSSVENTLVPKLEFLMSLGFEYEEVANMVLRTPGLLTFSIEKNYRPKIEYFVKEMNGDLKELKRFPQYFCFSLEGKIKPRHRVLVKNGFELPLKKMLQVSDGEFNARLIERRLRLLDEAQL